MNKYRDSIAEGCLFTLIALIIVIAFTFFGAWVATWLWGVIVVPVFNLPALSYWQMFGLIWLMRLVFSGGTTSSSRSK